MSHTLPETEHPSPESVQDAPEPSQCPVCGWLFYEWLLHWLRCTARDTEPGDLLTPPIPYALVDDQARGFAANTVARALAAH